MIGKRKYLRNLCISVLLVLLVFFPPKIQAQVTPDIPDIIRVTVDHTDNGVLIEWEPSADNDIMTYHIWKREPDFSFSEIDSVDAFTYQYKHLNAGSLDIAYSVTATDSTDIRSVFEGNVHRAVILSTDFNLCTQTNKLQWTHYEGWGNSIAGYRIFGGISGGPLQLLKSFPNDSTSYTHSGLENNTYYSYYIEAINTNRDTSLSAIDSVYTLYPEAPSYLILDHVNVLDEATLEIQFTADIAGPVKSFRLMRTRDTTSAFQEVETLWNILEPTQVIQDVVATGSISYYYKIESLFLPADCPTSIVMTDSNYGNNILLTNTLNDQMITLSWTPYEMYESGLAGYIIQRRRDGEEFADLVTVGPLVTQWQELIESLINGFQPGEVQYRVIALSNPFNGGSEEQSISNITTAVVETQMQVPNAFTPGSNDINAEFKPLMDFAPEEYLMIVVDRGGRKMFETTDPEEGWDGSFQGGSFVDEAVYVYYIQYTDYTGLFRTFTGNVTVLYP